MTTRKSVQMMLVVFALLGCAAETPVSAPGDSASGVCGYCTRHEDCIKPLACDLYVGACKALGTHGTTCNADCSRGKSWQGCRDQGRCTAKDGACIVAGPQDCQQSFSCYGHGKCVFATDRCVVGDGAACKISEACTKFGACGLWVAPDGSGHCRASSDADCAQSSQCKEVGRCSLSAKSCLPLSDADCAQSKLCHENGFCRVVNKHCVK